MAKLLLFLLQDPPCDPVPELLGRQDPIEQMFWGPCRATALRILLESWRHRSSDGKDSTKRGAVSP